MPSSHYITLKKVRLPWPHKGLQDLLEAKRDKAFVTRTLARVSVIFVYLFSPFATKHKLSAMLPR